MDIKYEDINQLNEAFQMMTYDGSFEDKYIPHDTIFTPQSVFVESIDYNKPTLEITVNISKRSGYRRSYHYHFTDENYFKLCIDYATYSKHFGYAYWKYFRQFYGGRNFKLNRPLTNKAQGAFANQQTYNATAEASALSHSHIKGVVPKATNYISSEYASHNSKVSKANAKVLNWAGKRSKRLRGGINFKSFEDTKLIRTLRRNMRNIQEGKRL
ncbi:MAG: hypothetical protein LBC06_01160 [Rickettsiales bacterium]|jgi:hypothetical protein|nr:hypothetical protein [Rickettsiales bacterium]